jgi:hypothetical protein
MRFYLGRRLGKYMVGTSASGREIRKGAGCLLQIIYLLFLTLCLVLISIVEWVRNFYFTAAQWINDATTSAINHPWISIFALILLPLIALYLIRGRGVVRE